MLNKENHKHASHKPQIHRLRRIEGQIRGVAKMIEEEKYCMDILIQLKAVKSAIISIENKILNEHINHCVHHAVHSKNSVEVSKKLKEIQDLLSKSGR